MRMRVPKCWFFCSVLFRWTAKKIHAHDTPGVVYVTARICAQTHKTHAFDLIISSSQELEGEQSETIHN